MTRCTVMYMCSVLSPHEHHKTVIALIPSKPNIQGFWHEVIHSSVPFHSAIYSKGILK